MLLVTLQKHKGTWLRPKLRISLAYYDEDGKSIARTRLNNSDNRHKQSRHTCAMFMSGRSGSVMAFNCRQNPAVCAVTPGIVLTR